MRAHHERQHGHDIIVVGASAGGVAALIQLVQRLPADLPAAALVVIHVPEHAPSMLPKILSRAGPLPASHPADGESIESGHIYCAPPGVHMVIEDNRIRLVAGPRENRHRPAIDPLFRTAALNYGPRVIGVVLTGALNDGTAGLLAIKRRGGLAVVQDPEEAQTPSMPANALAYVDVDQCLPLAEISSYLVAMAHTSATPESDVPAPENMQAESQMSGLRPERTMRDMRLGNLSFYTCPECKGPLWEIHDGKLLRFRCQIGHAYTSDALLFDQAEAVDDALWTALETLEQRLDIVGRLAERSRELQRFGAATRFEAQARDTREKIETLRKLIFSKGMREALINERGDDELAGVDNDAAKDASGGAPEDAATPDRVD